MIAFFFIGIGLVILGKWMLHHNRKEGLDKDAFFGHPMMGAVFQSPYNFIILGWILILVEILYYAIMLS